MQKDEFIKIVNAMIDARIKKIVPALIKKELTEAKQQLMKEISNGTANLPEQIDIPDLTPLLKEDVVLSKSTETSKSAPKISKTFTKNPKINAILQQTAEELSLGKTAPAADAEYMAQYKKLLTEQYQQVTSQPESEMETFNFNTSHISDIASKKAIATPNIQEEIEKKVALEMEKRQIEATTGNPELGGIIMKDYRSFMKKVEEKAKQKKPGV